MSRSTIALIITLLTVCSCQNRMLLQGFPVPERLNSTCCWQARQSLTVGYKERDFKLTAVLAYQPTELTLVIMGELDHRLITIRQRADGIQMEQSDLMPSGLPAELFLALVHALRVPVGRQTPGSRWTVAESEGSRIIRYRNEGLVTMETSGGDRPVAGETVRIRHLKQPLTIVVRTESVQSLDYVL